MDSSVKTRQRASHPVLEVLAAYEVKEKIEAALIQDAVRQGFMMRRDQLDAVPITMPIPLLALIQCHALGVCDLSLGLIPAKPPVKLHRN